MRQTTSDIIIVMIVITVIWPWVIGVLDIGAWAVTGEQLTSIVWNSSRGITLTFWPIVSVIVAIFLAMLVG